MVLRVTGKEVSYAPAAFFTAKILITCEFQYTAQSVRGSAVLAIRLLTSPRLIHCLLFSSFEKAGKYPAAMRTDGRAATAERCVVDLDREADGLRLAGTGNIVTRV